MKEYKCIETQDEEKRKKNCPNKIRPVSAKVPQESEKAEFNLLKLGHNDIPNKVLDKIERLIRVKMS